MLNAFDEELLELFGKDFTSDHIEAINQMIEKEKDEDKCDHHDICDSDGINICKLCGCEVTVLDFQPEWRYYGTSDTRSVSDPSRCHRSKVSTKGGISKVFQDAKLENLPAILKDTTEAKYKQIVGPDTVRGKGRKAIVAACLLYTFIEFKDYRTSDEVRNLFGLTRNDMSGGLKKYFEKFPADRSKTTTPQDMIRRTMKNAKIEDQEHYKKVVSLARILEKSDPTINRSNPQSVAAAIVYLYLCINPKLKEKFGITKTKYAKDVKLSDITISKLVKKAAEILQINITM